MKTVVRGLPEITDRVTPPPLCASEVAGVKRRAEDTTAEHRSPGRGFDGRRGLSSGEKKRKEKEKHGRVRHLQNKLLMCHAERHFHLASSPGFKTIRRHFK